MIMDMISSVGMPVDSRCRRLRRNERVHSISLGITGGRGKLDTGCESLDARQRGVRMIFRRRAGTLPVLNLEQFVKSSPLISKKPAQFEGGLEERKRLTKFATIH